MAQTTFWLTVLSLVLGLAIFGIILGLAIILIIGRRREHYTAPNLLICNTCLAAIAFLFITVDTCITGLRSTTDASRLYFDLNGYFSLMFSAAFIYSYVVQSISRLLSVLFSHKRYLLTWRTHCCLIAAGWAISLLLPVPPLVIGVCVREPINRVCVVTPQHLSTGMYLLFGSMLIPCSVSLFVYMFIAHAIRSSNKRVSPTTSMDLAPRILAKQHRRDLKLMIGILAQVAMYAVGNALNVFITICNQLAVPLYITDEVYLLGNVLVPIFIAIMLTMVCAINQTIRDTLVPKRRLSTHSQS